jgi:hypothetical protein
MLEKAKTIAKAFIDALPTEQEWYKKRVETCESCLLNSANIAEEDLTFMQKVEKKAKAKVCDDGNFCTACGCCILRKCSVKTETCGATEVGQTPKWLPIEVESAQNISMELLSSDSAVSYTGRELLIDFGGTSESVVKADFLLKAKSTIKFMKHSVSCGCTHLRDWTQIDNKRISFSVEISTVNFRQGLNEKTLSIELLNQQGRYVTVTVRFRIIKL